MNARSRSSRPRNPAEARSCSGPGSSYASKDDVATIAAHYEKTTGRKATTGAKGERHLEWDADHKLDIYPAARNDDFPHCAQKPARGERSVILMSSVAR